MLKKFVGAAIVMVLVSSVALAETVVGIISKASDKEITITPFKKKEKGEPVTIKLDSKTKIMKGSFKKSDTEPEAIEAKDFVKMVMKAAEGEGKMKGIFAKVEYEEGKAATSVTVMSFGGGKKGGKKKEKE